MLLKRSGRIGRKSSLKKLDGCLEKSKVTKSFLALKTFSEACADYTNWGWSEKVLFKNLLKQFVVKLTELRKVSKTISLKTSSV